VHDIAAIRARCRLASISREQTFSHSTLFAFGPHWASLRGVEVGVDEEIARLETPEAVAAESDRWGLHPAMLDEALSFAAARMEGKFMPMGYGRVLVRAPLPAMFWSHLRYRDTGSAEIIVADVTLIDDDGVELVSIAEFVLRRIDAEAIRADYATPAAEARAVAPALAATGTDAIGIAPADGVEALRRLFGADLGPQVAVTAADLHATIAGARALTQRSVEEDLAQAVTDRPERTLETEYVPARTDLERALCVLWQDALGLDLVGVDDDFLAAGGNSLVAVQLLGGIRKETGQRVPMRSLFESSTVAGMAAEIERIRKTASSASSASPEEPQIMPLGRAR
jgi:hypothetical protein